jgi:hypothetical protein
MNSNILHNKYIGMKIELSSELIVSERHSSGFLYTWHPIFWLNQAKSGV